MENTSESLLINPYPSLCYSKRPRPKVPLLQGGGGGGVAVGLCVGIRGERKVAVVTVPACADELGLG